MATKLAADGYCRDPHPSDCVGALVGDLANRLNGYIARPVRLDTFPITAEQQRTILRFPVGVFMDPSLMRKAAFRYVAGATAVAASLSLVACGGGE